MKTQKLKAGMVFDVYQDGKETFRAMTLESGVINLSYLLKEGVTLFVDDLDFENEVEEVVVEDILNIN